MKHQSITNVGRIDMTLEKCYKDDLINLGCELTEECFACGYIVQAKYDDLLHDSIGELIWCGIFGFCGCGNMQREIVAIHRTLKCYNNGEVIPDELQIYAYLLDKYEFTEHGSSIYSAILTQKGISLLNVISKEIEFYGKINNNAYKI